MRKLVVYSGIMEMMREAWTDERLDDLVRRMDQGFDRVDGDLREIRGEVRGLRGEFDSRFSRLEARFDSMQRMTLAAYLTALVGLAVTQF
jgi:hypothetical protein